MYGEGAANIVTIGADINVETPQCPDAPNQNQNQGDQQENVVTIGAGVDERSLYQNQMSNNECVQIVCK
eukprot:UN13537